MGVAKRAAHRSKLFDNIVAGIWSLVLLSALASVLGGPTYAQNRNSGEIRGTVTDAGGAVVPSVAITIQNTQTGVITNLVSDSTGVYDAASVPLGPYTVSFEKQGFKKLLKTNIVMTVEPITVNATLDVGSTTQQVTVTTGVEMLQTETSSKQLSLETSMIAALPIINNNPFDMTGLIPGAGPGGAGTFNISLDRDNSLGFGEGVGINGQPGYQENRLADGGVDTILEAGNSSSMEPPPNAIGEFGVHMQNTSAEYGNSPSVINMIMKSGTNQYHGDVFDLNGNEIFNARNFFQPHKLPYHLHQFGGNVGGPIIHNKFFFFVDYEYWYSNLYAGLTEASAINTYPTAAMRAGDFTGLPPVYDPATTMLLPDGSYTRTQFPNNQIPLNRFDPAAMAVQSYFPLPNLPGDVNNYVYGDSSPRIDQRFETKEDYDISSGNRLDFSLGMAPLHFPPTGPTCYEKIGCSNLQIVDPLAHAQLSDVWSITPNAVNEFRVSVMDDHETTTAVGLGSGWSSKLNIPNLTTDTFPGIAISGTAAPTGLEGATDNIYATDAVELTDSLTIIRGKHILKFGGQFETFRYNNDQPPVPATFSFNGLYTENTASPGGTGLGYADFLLGQVNSWTDSWSPESAQRTRSFQFFAQDDFKITPKLTLNLGLRWTIQGGFGDAHNKVGGFDPTLINPATGTPGAIWFGGQLGRSNLERTVYDGFEPRIGFAWAPKPNWTVRGAFGVYDYTWGGNLYGNGEGLGNTVSGSDVSTNDLTPVFLLQNGHVPPSPTPVFPPSASFFNGTSVPYVPYNTPLAYTQQWNFTVQHQFTGNVMLEVGYIGSHSAHLIDPTGFNQVSAANIAQYGAIGVNMQSYRPYPQYQNINYYSPDGWANYDALQVTLKKAFSHDLMAMTSYTWGHCLDTDTQNGWIGTANVWQIAQDPRALYGNCDNDVSSIWNGGFVYRLPFGSGNAYLNRGGVLNGFAGGWQLSSQFSVLSGQPFTPVWAGTNLDFALSGSLWPDRVCSGAISNPSPSQEFNPSCFAQPAPGQFGNSGRNIVFGPSVGDWDLSLAKSFDLHFLGEQGKLQVRTDVRDLLNSPNFSQAHAGVTPPPTTAGAVTTATTNRIIELEGKITF